MKFKRQLILLASKLKFPMIETQANILLSRPSLRGSTPLDIAYSSLMDNTELALAMREHHLEKIAVYLSRCGLTSNAELTAKGYPDLGWVSAIEHDHLTRRLRIRTQVHPFPKKAETRLAK